MGEGSDEARGVIESESKNIFSFEGYIYIYIVKFIIFEISLNSKAIYSNDE